MELQKSASSSEVWPDSTAPTLMCLFGGLSFTWMTFFTNVQDYNPNIFHFIFVYVSFSVYISYCLAGIIGMLPKNYRKKFITVIDIFWVLSGTLGITLALSSDMAKNKNIAVMTFFYRLFIVLAGGVRLSKNISELMWEV